MIYIETLEVNGTLPALHGMRNPKNSWGKQDSHYVSDVDDVADVAPVYIGPNDYNLYPQVAQCITPSFRVSENILKGLLNIAPTKLRPIVAYLSVEWHREEKTENEHE